MLNFVGFESTRWSLSHDIGRHITVSGFFTATTDRSFSRSPFSTSNGLSQCADRFPFCRPFLALSHPSLNTIDSTHPPDYHHISKPAYTMDQLFQLDGGTTQLTLPQFMDEMITQKLRCWRAAQEKIPDGRLAEQIMAMCWGGSDGNVLKEPGCLLPDHHKGGYVFVPYNEGEHLSPELVAGKERLERALQDKANAALARRMDKALEREVNEKCFWEFLDGDSAARVDFHGKVSRNPPLPPSSTHPHTHPPNRQINILAKHRLIQEGIDVSPASPAHPQFRFGLTDITESGTVNMHWRSLPWSCTESDVVRVLTTFSRPNFSPESALRAQLADLATIEYPADAAEEARGLEKELRERAPVVVGEPEWQYILCRAEEQKVPA